MKILLVYQGYPRLSQTYQTDEAQYLRDQGHELLIYSYNWTVDPKYVSDQALPYICSSPERDIARIRKFAPDVVHSCFLETIPMIERLCNRIPSKYTIRAHSYDVLRLNTIRVSSRCLAILTFPSWTQYFPSEVRHLVREYYPMIKISRYQLDLTIPKGNGIMSGGACLPKKDIYGFIDHAVVLKERFPDKEITYYTMPEDPAYYRMVQTYNTNKGSPVIFRTVQTTEMPYEYSKHTWLIYGACETFGTVGFPLMIAEAQAAGVMVIMYKLRPDAELYLSGTGYFYKTVDDIISIIDTGPDPEKIQSARNLCDRYDIYTLNMEQIWRNTMEK